MSPFPRYFEKRQKLSDKIKDNPDPVDVALVKFSEVQERFRKAQTTGLGKILFHNKEREDAYRAVFAAVDVHVSWIYKFMSPFGEAYVKTVEDAVAVCARAEAYNLKGKKLAEWKEHKRRDIRASLELIKLGVDGGVAGHVR